MRWSLTIQPKRPEPGDSKGFQPEPAEPKIDLNRVMKASTLGFACEEDDEAAVSRGGGLIRRPP